MAAAEVIVVGAGLNGLLTARECAAAGWNVTVLDRNTDARPASWAAGGILSPLEPWLESEASMALARAGQTIFPVLTENLIRETGIDPGYLKSGMLILEPGEPERIAQWADQSGEPCRVVDAGELRLLEPALQPSFASGIQFPGIHQIRNPRLMRALRQSLQQTGVAFQSVAGTELLIEGQACRGVRADGREYQAGRVVVAAGAWSSALMEGIAPELPVKPVRGQMLAYQASSGILRHIVLCQRRYLVPREGGLILAGSTVEDVGFDAETTAEAARDLRAMAGWLMPALGDLEPAHHWSGLRPATADGLPYIGAHPAVSGLYLNYGHFRNGVLQAPASARLLADIMLGREKSLPAKPYSPARMA